MKRREKTTVSDKQRMSVHDVDPEAYKPMLAMEKYIHAGTLGEPLLALVKIRASQIKWLRLVPGHALQGSP